MEQTKQTYNSQFLEKMFKYNSIRLIAQDNYTVKKRHF